MKKLMVLVLLFASAGIFAAEHDEKVNDAERMKSLQHSIEHRRWCHNMGKTQVVSARHFYDLAVKKKEDPTWEIGELRNAELGRLRSFESLAKAELELAQLEMRVALQEIGRLKQENSALTTELAKLKENGVKKRIKNKGESNEKQYSMYYKFAGNVCNCSRQTINLRKALNFSARSRASRNCSAYTSHATANRAPENSATQ